MVLLSQLMTCFEDCFYGACNTRLIKGDCEPIYIPASEQCTYHQVVFAHGYFSSALHEIAHWCLAGKHRRSQLDYGYWYAEDGRTEEQQALFESVEVKPQAIEWFFSKASGQPFRVSVDNLKGDYTDPRPFKEAIFQQVLEYCSKGLPERASIFHDALLANFNSDYQMSPSHFTLEEL